MAVCFEKDNKPERALQILNTLKQICPQPADVKVSINLGTILQKQGHFSKAEAHFEQALKILTTNNASRDDKFAAHFNLGLNHLHQSKFAQACDQLTFALKQLSNVSNLTTAQLSLKFNAHLNLAIARQAMGSDQQAEDHLAQCLKIDPTNNQALQLQKKLNSQEANKAEAADAKAP